jgi:hypothetical protein
MQNTASKRAFIPGRGFAGLTVAMELGKKLAQNPVVDVMLVNRENFFLFTHGLRYRGSPTFRTTNQYLLTQLVPISTFGNYGGTNPSKHWRFGRGGGDRICGTSHKSC